MISPVGVHASEPSGWYIASTSLLFLFLLFLFCDVVVHLPPHSSSFSFPCLLFSGFLFILLSLPTSACKGIIKHDRRQRRDGRGLGGGMMWEGNWGLQKKGLRKETIPWGGERVGNQFYKAGLLLDGVRFVAPETFSSLLGKIVHWVFSSPPSPFPCPLRRGRWMFFLWGWIFEFRIWILDTMQRGS